MSDQHSLLPTQLARANVAAMQPYVPGIQPSDLGWVKLNTNENPYPPSPKVREAILQQLGEDASLLRLYPNPQSLGLRQAIADFHQIDVSQVCIGNGSDDVLNLLIRVFGDADKSVASITPSYSLYQTLVKAQGAPWIDIPFDANFTLPIEQAANCGANLLFLTSPNAPTGVAFTLEQIAELAERFPGILVIDETYVNFGGASALPLLQRFPRLVLTRSFSKAYGLAGLRLGYALAHADTVSLLDRVRDSYNVDRLAQAAAIAAIQDTGYYNQLFATIIGTRDQFVNYLENRGWFTYPSKANFVFTAPLDAQGQSSPEVAGNLYRYLLDHKVLVRYFGNHELTSRFLRISIGSEQEMSKLKDLLESWQ